MVQLIFPELKEATDDVITHLLQTHYSPFCSQYSSESGRGCCCHMSDTLFQTDSYENNRKHTQLQTYSTVSSQTFRFLKSVRRRRGEEWSGVCNVYRAGGVEEEPSVMSVSSLIPVLRHHEAAAAVSCKFIETGHFVLPAGVW